MKQYHISKVPCPECGEQVESDEWRPEDGFDPDMRHFDCPGKDGVKCKGEWYQVVRGTSGREVKKRMAAGAFVKS